MRAIADGEVGGGRCRGLRDAGRSLDPMHATIIAVRLCVDHRANFGNFAASAGWQSRAW